VLDLASADGARKALRIVKAQFATARHFGGRSRRRVSASSELRLEASMRIRYVRVFVTDLAAAKRFYAQILGLNILWEYENKAIGFDLGPVLIVEDVSSEEDRNERHLAGRYVGCSIEVEDIQATYSELAAKGVHFTAPPEKQEWGGTLAHFEDPAGNVLTLVGSS
jgi:catechol 2,3-dioxygenase-like lactoylglutathione lyase family enzyme